MLKKLYSNKQKNQIEKINRKHVRSRARIKYQMEMRNFSRSRHLDDGYINISWGKCYHINESIYYIKIVSLSLQLYPLSRYLPKFYMSWDKFHEKCPLTIWQIKYTFFIFLGDLFLFEYSHRHIDTYFMKNEWSKFDLPNLNIIVHDNWYLMSSMRDNF